MKVHREVLTISNYLFLMRLEVNPIPTTLDGLRDVMDKMQDSLGLTIWDYPLEEIEIVDSSVALVTDGTDYRWYEIAI